MISSFVSSASVGVYFTEQYYTQKAYTTRRPVPVVTNFSVISVGYIGVLASIAGIEEMYGVLLIASFVLVLVMGAIMIRIPPLSMIPDTCIDGSAPVVTTRRMSFSERFRLAVEQGAARSEQFTAKAFLQNFLQAMKFAQKTIGVMVPTVMLVLTLVYYTPLFQWIGAPLAPVLGLFGVPDAALAAPSVLIGIVEISLPSILVSGTGACAARCLLCSSALHRSDHLLLGMRQRHSQFQDPPGRRQAGTHLPDAHCHRHSAGGSAHQSYLLI